MGRLVHTSLGSSYLIAHVLHCPPPPPHTALADAGSCAGAKGSPDDAHRLTNFVISPVMANTCLPPSSSRLMIHRHSSVASRPRNACGMLGTVSSPIAQRAAAKRAAEAPRADAPGARHQKGAQSRFLTVMRGTLRCRPFALRYGARQSKLNVYCACVCV